MNITTGNQYQSRWGLVVTVLNVRDITAKRNILLGYTDPTTDKSHTLLLSAKELQRRYPYHVGVLASIALQNN